MTKKLQLRFKKDARETGLRAIGAAPRGYSIMLEELLIGKIGAKSVSQFVYDETCWQFSLKIPRKVEQEGCCPWGWKILKQTFSTAEEAKEYIKANTEEILKLCYKG